MHIDATKLFDNKNVVPGMPAVSGLMDTVADTEGQKKTDENGAVFSLKGTKDKDSFTYGKPGSEKDATSLEDVMEEAGTLNAVTMKNEMVVSANSVSADDAKAIEDDGFSLRSTDIHTVVTETDKIKAVLAKAGKDISNMGPMSEAEIAELSGGLAANAAAIEAALTNADLPATEANVTEIGESLAKLCSIGEIPDTAKAYLIENDLAPTVDNVFRAVNMRGREYIDQTQENWGDTVPEQAVKDLFARAHIMDTPENTDAAMWLMDKGIGITSENIRYKKELDSIELPVPVDKAIGMMTDAVNEGKRPQDALFTGSIYEKAEEAVRIIDEATDEDLEFLIDEGLDITVDNLAQAHEINQSAGDRQGYEGRSDRGSRSFGKQGDSEPSNGRTVSDEREAKLLTAKRQLEETRLMMTVEAGFKLMKQGIKIDTTELSGLVEGLKKLEQDYYRNLLGTEAATTENIEIFSEFETKRDELITMPASALTLALRDEEFNVENLHREGTAHRARFDAAGERYETMATEVRADLGDSMKKAFSNVDDILDDLGYEATEENRRAVRILGYNRAEIVPDNVEKMKAADELVQRAFDSLKPAVVRELIQKGINPLSMDLQTLTQKAEEIRKSLASQNDAESFAKYLYRLEQNDEIAPEERESYIGIYRLINRVNASDGAAVGAVVESGRELTMESLISAVRSRKKGAMDYKVDDDFEGVKGTIRGKSITDQVNEAFRMITAPDMAGDKKYYDDALKDFEHAAAARQEVYEAVRQYEIIPSADNIIVMENLMQSPDTGLKRFFRLSEDDFGEDVKDDVMERFKAAKDEIFKAFADDVKTPDELAQALETLADVAEHCMQTFERDGMTAIDIRQMQLACMQLNITSHMARSKHYNIPVETEDGVSNVSLRIVSSEDDKGTATVFTDDTRYGRISAKLMLKDGSVKGYIACDSRAGADMLRAKSDELENKSIDILYSRDVNDMAYGLNGNGSIGRAELETLFDEASKLIKFFA